MSSFKKYSSEVPHVMHGPPGHTNFHFLVQLNEIYDYSTKPKLFKSLCDDYFSDLNRRIQRQNEWNDSEEEAVVLREIALYHILAAFLIKFESVDSLETKHDIDQIVLSFIKKKHFNVVGATTCTASGNHSSYTLAMHLIKSGCYLSLQYVLANYSVSLHQQNGSKVNIMDLLIETNQKQSDDQKKELIQLNGSDIISELIEIYCPPSSALHTRFVHQNTVNELIKDLDFDVVEVPEENKDPEEKDSEEQIPEEKDSEE